MMSLQWNEHPRGYNIHNYCADNDPDNDVWEGRKPLKILDNGLRDYETWFGGVYLDENDNVYYANIALNPEVHVFILDDFLDILDNRGVNGVWEYTNTGTDYLPDTPSLRLMDDDRIEQILKPNHIDCWLWNKVCDRALKLYKVENSS